MSRDAESQAAARHDLMNEEKAVGEQGAFVQLTYDELARLGQSDLCCSPTEIYRDEELAALPAEVLRLSSGCGHPVDGADIVTGETVVDIGSGAGADCFLAARLTGPTGRVVGVDPAPAMRALAARNRDRTGLSWVRFESGDAAALPQPDASADVVISNCVLSLAIDSVTAWREIARVLRPGGRFVVSDVIGGAPDAGLAAKARCETGLSWSRYRAVLRDCGLCALRILRIGPADFRDGFRAQSVTVAGRRPADGAPDGVAAVVLHRCGHADAAAALAERVAGTCQGLGLRYDGYTQSSGTEWGRRLLDLFDGSPDADLLLVLDAGAVLAARAADLPGLGPTIEDALREVVRR